jgi:hypothetical protein
MGKKNQGTACVHTGIQVRGGGHGAEARKAHSPGRRRFGDRRRRVAPVDTACPRSRRGAVAAFLRTRTARDEVASRLRREVEALGSAE